MIPAVLSGGSGTRLWPVSRSTFPKQFNEILDESLLRKTLRRVAPLGRPWVIAVAETGVLTRRVLDDLGLPSSQVIYEPTGRNTAPAVALLCHLFDLDGRGDSVVGIFPADHLVTREDRFRRACTLAEACARQGQVVTLGIRPVQPSTGYGYIEVSDEVFASEADGGEPLKARVTRGFREKPDAAMAEQFVANGRFFWNSGIFIFQVSVMADHFARLMPDLWGRIRQVQPDRSNLPDVYADITAESLDYGVMEHLEGEHMVTIPCDLGWSDVGSWDEVARLRETGHTVFEESARNNFVFPYRDKIYALLGVEDLIVVDTADAVLVAHKGSSQAVKEMVDTIKKAGVGAAVEHVFEHRPWGDFEILRDTDDFKSKILHVNPGQQLSYQSHRHRREHWVIVKGYPEVILDDDVLQLAPGEHIYIPQGAKHRIRNPGEEVVELVEVQLGTYFGEDDITRYEDDYDRT